MFETTTQIWILFPLFVGKKSNPNQPETSEVRYMLRGCCEIIQNWVGGSAVLFLTPPIR